MAKARTIPSAAGGFTLVELMIVVVIIAIAAAMVVPQMASSQEIKVQAAARMVVGDLTYAQNEAVSHQTTRKVIFDPANNTYRLTDGAGTTLTAPWKGGNYVVDFNADRSYTGVVITKADFGGNAEVSFDDLGSPSTGGTIELTAGGRTYRVTVTPFTGRITVALVTGG